MNYIILDLEATCWRKRPPNQPNEIIEIGALKIDQRGNILSEFAAFVRPKLNPTLSNFCTELTSIEQADVDAAENYPTVLERFQDWIDLDKPYFLCSWGFYDKKQFIADGKLHGLPNGWLENHMSIKHQYADLKNLRKPIGMGKALQKEGLKLEGTHHRGIDDARNIAKIFLVHFDFWRF